MKKINYLIVSFLLFSFNLPHVAICQKNDDLSRLDTTAFKGRAFLNKANFLKQLVEQYRNVEKSKNGTPIYKLTARQFELLTKTVVKSSLKEKELPDNFKKFNGRSLDEKTSANKIPIGIISSEAVILTAEQIEENVKLKSNNKKADGEKYEKVDIVTACLMQSELYQKDVQLQLDVDLLISDNNNKIKEIELDFQDGKGWRKYEFKNQLIDYTFDRIGKTSIGIKLKTSKGEYITYSTLDVKQLERPKIF